MALAALIKIQVVNELVGGRNLAAGVQVVTVVDGAEYLALGVGELLLEVLAVRPGGKAHDFVQRAGYDGILRADGALRIEGSDRRKGDAHQQDYQRPAQAERGVHPSKMRLFLNSEQLWTVLEL
jgi:hypothetical protein